MQFVAVLACALGTAAAVGIPDSSAGGHIELHVGPADEVSAKFSAFIQEHGRAYEEGSEEYQTRLAHFEARLAAVDAHNSQPDRLWSAGLNLLADHTPAELAMLRGYRHTARGPSGGGSLGLASTSVREVDVSKLPKNFSWELRLAAMRDVRDQSSCGSCWAISSSTVLRAHAELYQQDRTFSTQQIVECTPNPQECGGQGGCKGATAELAMDYAVNIGLATEEDHKYLATDKACAKPMQASKQGLQSQAQGAVSFPEVVTASGRGGASFGMTGWERLPSNALEPLLLAVYEKGPVVVSVAATDAWSMYRSGIMNACDKGAVINHAVVLVGYGEEAKNPFWQIQNSWSPTWGEKGFIRMFRHTNQEEGAYCGWDTKPNDGTGCLGGPSKVWTCGSCGVLYDSVVPTFALSKHGFLARHIRDSTGVFTQLNASTVKHLRH